jgi:biopolymer transport protein ExbB/TolQ
MMDFLSQILLEVSNALLIPVILALFYFFALSVLHLGGLFSETLSRRKHQLFFQEYLGKLKYFPEFQVKLEEIPANFGLPKRAFRDILLDSQVIDKHLNDLQLYSERCLNMLNMGIRLGPVLGLAGTLIPLGPALLGLSSGNVTELGSKLVVAFTTTVMGLFIGGVCYVIYTIRAQWYVQDLNDIEFILTKKYKT